MTHFKNITKMQTYNGTQSYGARKKVVQDLQERWKSKNPSEKVIYSTQHFSLPFRVDDLNSKNRYKGAGSWEQKWEVVEKAKGRRKRRQQAEVIGFVSLLKVQLVAEDKKEKKRDKTPKKKSFRAVRHGCSSDDSSSNDEDSSSDEGSGSDEEINDGDGNGNVSDNEEQEEADEIVSMRTNRSRRTHQSVAGTSAARSGNHSVASDLSMESASRASAGITYDDRSRHTQATTTTTNSDENYSTPTQQVNPVVFFN